MFLRCTLTLPHSAFHCGSVDDEDEDEAEEGEKATEASASEEAATAADAPAEDAPAGDAPAGEPAGKRAKLQGAQLQDLTEEEIEALDQNELQCAVTMLEEKLKQLKPNMAAIREYRKKEQDYLSRVQDLDTVTAERDELRRHFEVRHDTPLMAVGGPGAPRALGSFLFLLPPHSARESLLSLQDLRKQRLDMFMAGFMTITTKLKEMYQMITLGGDAELELVDRLNPFSEGIVFSVRRGGAGKQAKEGAFFTRGGPCWRAF